MAFLKQSTISLFLMCAVTFPGAQGATMRQMNEFIKHMEESEKRNGPIRVSKPSLAKFLTRSEQVGNLKGSSAEPRVSKEDLQRQLDYYANYPLFAEEKRSKMKEDDLERKLYYNQYNNGGNGNYNQYNNGGNANYNNANNQYGNGGNGNYNQYNNGGNANGNYNNANNQYANGNANGNGNYNNANNQYANGNANGNYNNGQRNYNNGQNAYNNANGQNQNQNGNRNWWNWGSNNNAENMEGNNYTDASMYESNNQTYSLNNLADLSLKYAGCSSVTSYVGVEEDAEEGSSGFASTALVQYRLCPAQSCSDDSWQGCASEYGEYMMSLQDFLEIQVDFKEQQFEALCEYCNQCEEYNDSDYCEDGQQCCSHTDDCEEYKEICEGNDEENEIPQFDDLFECMEVSLDDDDDNNNNRNLNWYNGNNNNYNRQNNNGGGGSWWGWGNNRNQYNNNNYYPQNAAYGYDQEEEGNNVAYLGIHCNGQNMEIGLFSDYTCTTIIPNAEEVYNITDLAGVDFNTEELEEYFVPQGCLACGGEEYNDKQQWWYIEADKDEENDEDMIYEVCNNMYEASAKCNMNLADDIQEQLEESDAQQEGEQVTCDFIKDAITGMIDENGFVMSHEQEQENRGTLSRFWQYMTDPGAQDPAYSGVQGQYGGYNNYGQTNTMQGRYSNMPNGAQGQYQQGRMHRGNRVSPAQTVSLTLGAIGTLAMGAAAFFLQKEYNEMTPRGLMHNQNAEISLPYDNQPTRPSAPTSTPSKARLID